MLTWRSAAGITTSDGAEPRSTRPGPGQTDKAGTNGRSPRPAVSAIQASSCMPCQWSAPAGSAGPWNRRRSRHVIPGSQVRRQQTCASPLSAAGTRRAPDCADGRDGYSSAHGADGERVRYVKYVAADSILTSSSGTSSEIDAGACPPTGRRVSASATRQLPRHCAGPANRSDKPVWQSELGAPTPPPAGPDLATRSTNRGSPPTPAAYGRAAVNRPSAGHALPGRGLVFADRPWSGFSTSRRHLGSQRTPRSSPARVGPRRGGSASSRVGSVVTRARRLLARRRRATSDLRQQRLTLKIASSAKSATDACMGPN